MEDDLLKSSYLLKIVAGCQISKSLQICMLIRESGEHLHVLEITGGKWQEVMTFGTLELLCFGTYIHVHITLSTVGKFFSNDSVDQKLEMGQNHLNEPKTIWHINGPKWT